MPITRHFAFSALLLLLSLSALAQAPRTREQVIAETMKPYAGPSNPGVDPSTLIQMLTPATADIARMAESARRN